MENQDIKDLNEKISILKKEIDLLKTQNVKNNFNFNRDHKSFNSLLLAINNDLNNNAYYCPICEKHSIIFLPFGEGLRPDVMCPYCGSAERHRLLYFYFKKLDDFKKNIKLLHFAPEDLFYKIFNNCNNIDYYPTDIVQNPKNRIEMDMQNIPFEDNYFDIIYNSHVLEHVPDDIKGMKELYRTIKPESEGGKVIIMAPVFYSLAKTLEKEEYNTPELRKKFYGQSDHFRKYGADFDDKLRSVGFDVEIVTAEDLVENKEDIEKMCIGTGEKVYVCTKPNEVINEDVVICCIAKNEEEYFEEWLDHHLNLGFDKIYIYDNNDNPGLQEFLKKYLDANKIEIIKNTFEVAPQIKCYDDFLENYDFKWGLFIDIDEFMTLSDHKNIKLFLKDFENEECILINWMFFGSNGHEKKTNGTVQERFKLPILPIEQGVNKHVKAMVKKGSNGRFSNATPHCPVGCNKYCNVIKNEVNVGPFQGPDLRVAYIKHYMLKSFEEFYNKRMRGRPNRIEKEEEKDIEYIRRMFLQFSDKPFPHIDEKIKKLENSENNQDIDYGELITTLKSLGNFEKIILNNDGDNFNISINQNQICLNGCNELVLLKLFNEFKNINFVLKTKTLPEREFYLRMLTYSFATDNGFKYTLITDS
ncbi:MAG: glycosyltransferase family 2 protein [Methanobrevibacter sp.]|jgi:predicted SAM-dependent methyltransferase|nr:glycosyltransferase family 2 protein [Candidatus Methanoflexus mossambicus]